MGAWGVRPFENDDAADFVHDVEARGLDAIIASLGDMAEPADYRGSDMGCRALASAAMIAAVADGETDLLSPEAVRSLAGIRKAIVAEQPGLKRLALSALDFVRGPESELDALWRDSPSADAWNAVVDDVRERLSR